MLPIIVIFLIIILGIMNYLIRKIINKSSKFAWLKPKNLVKINNINTHIIVKGKGEPLIFIHGGQMNLYDYKHNLEYFSKYFTVYAFDMVGCGFTDKPKIAYSPDQLSSFINDIMLHFNISKASFVASSWGGGLVLHFALNYPNKVKKLILSSPCGFSHKMLSTYNILSTPVLGRLALLYNSKALVRNELYKAFHDKKFVDEDLVHSVYVSFYTKGYINSTVKTAKTDFSFVENNLEKITAPVLIIWGTHDRIHPRWMMEKMHNSLKNSQLYIIDNIGHLPHNESFDVFNKNVLEFLVGN